MDRTHPSEPRGRHLPRVRSAWYANCDWRVDPATLLAVVAQVAERSVETREDPVRFWTTAPAGRSAVGSALDCYTELRYTSGMKRESAGDGYSFVVVPGHPMADKRGRVLEHRYLMAEAIGRSLRGDEVVHHRNEDPSDNRLENLELMGAGAHVRLHHPLKESEYVCPKCGKQFKRTQRQANGKRVFCSRPCSVGFYSARRHKELRHGATGYRRGCRCSTCRQAQTVRIRKQRHGVKALW